MINPFSLALFLTSFPKNHRYIFILFFSTCLSHNLPYVPLLLSSHFFLFSHPPPLHSLLPSHPPLSTPPPPSPPHTPPFPSSSIYTPSPSPSTHSSPPILLYLHSPSSSPPLTPPLPSSSIYTPPPPPLHTLLLNPIYHKIYSRTETRLNDSANSCLECWNFYCLQQWLGESGFLHFYCYHYFRREMSHNIVVFYITVLMPS